MVIRKSLQAIARCHLSVAAMAFFRAAAAKLKAFFSDKKNIRALIIASAHALITLIILSRHEIWSDEAHVWLQLKYKTLAELFRYSMGEGHPFLFHAILFPFVKIGFSMNFVRIFCWLSSSAGIFFFIRYAPFGGWLKASVLLSSPFLYFFPVFSRSYALIPLFLFAAGAVYPLRHSHYILYVSILLCLASSHFLMTLPALFLLAVFFADSYKKLSFSVFKYCFVIALAVFFFLYFQADAAFNENQFYNISFKGDTSVMLDFLQSFFSCFTEYFVTEEYTMKFGLLMNAGYLFSVFFIAALLFFLFYLSPKYYAGAFIALVAHFFIYFFVYPLVYPVRAYCFSSFLLFLFWLAFSDLKCGGKLTKNIVFKRRMSEILLCAFFAMSIPTGLRMAVYDIFRPFSSAAEMADYIRNNVPEDAVIFSVTNFIESLIYNLPDREILNQDKQPLKYTLNYGDYYYTKEDFIPYLDKGQRIYVLYNWNADIYEKGLPGYSTKLAIKNRETFVLCEYYAERFFYGPPLPDSLRNKSKL